MGGQDLDTRGGGQFEELEGLADAVFGFRPIDHEAAQFTAPGGDDQAVVADLGQEVLAGLAGQPVRVQVAADAVNLDALGSEAVGFS